MLNFDPIQSNMLQNELTPELSQKWTELVALVCSKYLVEQEWQSGGKNSKYELVLKKNGKIFLSLLPMQYKIGIMLVFNKEEQCLFEKRVGDFSQAVLNQYHATHVFHGAKWVVFDYPCDELRKDLFYLLALKCKPDLISNGND